MVSIGILLLLFAWNIFFSPKFRHYAEFYIHNFPILSASIWYHRHWHYFVSYRYSHCNIGETWSRTTLGRTSCYIHQNGRKKAPSVELSWGEGVCTIVNRANRRPCPFPFLRNYGERRLWKACTSICMRRGARSLCVESVGDNRWRRDEYNGSLWRTAA